MKVIAYTRVSTDMQADNGDSLDVQRSKVEAYCDLHDHDLVDVYTDAGASAKNMDRPGLRSALDALEDGEADGLVIYKLDRLTRSTADLGRLLEWFEDSEVALQSVAESLDTSTAAGRMVVRMLGVVAEWERETIGERTSEAMQAKRDQGGYIGGTVPFGYREEDGELVHDDDEQRILARIRQLRSEGLSLADIASELNDRGITRREGKDWHKVALSRVLNSEYREHDADLASSGAETDDGDGEPGEAEPNTSCNTEETEDSEAEPSPLETIRQLRSEGLSLRDIADELNDRGIKRSNGNSWHHVAVSRALD